MRCESVGNPTSLVLCTCLALVAAYRQMSMQHYEVLDEYIFLPILESFVPFPSESAWLPGDLCHGDIVY